MEGKLTAKQQRFVDAFDGNATDAAIKAGYSKKSAALIGNENLRKPLIVRAIKAREQKRIAPAIWDREKRQEFWTATANDETIDIKARLKASELLGRSEADFIERVQHQGEVAIRGIEIEIVRPG